MENQDQHPKKAPSVFSIILSTFAAAFGVQSQKNQEKDFSRGNIFVFIIAGIIFTILFIIAVATLVNIAINSQ